MGREALISFALLLHYPFCLIPALVFYPYLFVSSMDFLSPGMRTQYLVYVIIIHPTLGIRLRVWMYTRTLPRHCTNTTGRIRFNIDK